MKLSDELKDKLRLEIEKKLNIVPEGVKIKIDKELLENLLFDFLVVNDYGDAVLSEQPVSDSEKHAKVPVWSGEFLSKIDLSEISFNNLLAGICGYKDGFFDDVCSLVDAYPDDDTFCRYFNTNQDLGLDDDNFDEYVLRDKYSKKIIYKNLNINFDKNFIHTIFTNIDFEGTDLSKLNKYSWDFDTSSNVNFKNTGIKINFCKKDYFERWLVPMVLSKKLDGCYLNGILVNDKNREDILMSFANDDKLDFERLNNELKLFVKNDILNDKEKENQDQILFNTILKSIDNQIKHQKVKK